MHHKASRPARQGSTASDVLAEIKQRIRERICLPDLAHRLGIEQKGAGWLCPFHDDHNPSFGLRNDHYCCFACGAKGDCFDLVMRLTGCSFMEAVKFLCDAVGLEFPFDSPRRRRAQAPPARPPEQALKKAPARSAEPTPGGERASEVLTWFARSVAIGPGAPDSHPALQYLRRRGISPTTARGAGLGHVGDYRRVHGALRDRFPLQELQDAGLFNAAGNLRLYRHRLVMPFAFNGRVYGLQARNVDWRGKDRDGPKELLLGSPRVPFGCDVLADGVGRVFLTEGVIDCLSLLELGLPAVGVPGAMGFRPGWVPLFGDVPEVVVAFDNDGAGRRGTRKVVDAFAAAGRRDVRVVAWPEGVKDVNDFCNYHY
jgi:DNA primase